MIGIIVIVGFAIIFYKIFLAEIVKGLFGLSVSKLEDLNIIKEKNQVNKITKNDESEAMNYNSIGLNYYYDNDYRMAINNFTSAIALNAIREYYLNRGNCYEQLSEYKNAINDYYSVLKSNSWDDYCNFKCACIYYKLNNYKEALLYLKFAIRNRPKEEYITFRDKIIKLHFNNEKFD